jgi:hypothetical protein
MGNNMPDEPDVSILGKTEEATSFSKMLQPTKELHDVTSPNTVISIVTPAGTSNVIYYYFRRVNVHLFLILDTIRLYPANVENMVNS